MKMGILVLAMATATPVAARDLGVPADKGWKHAETGLILTAQLAGLARVALTDSTQTEHDVAAQYETADKTVSATIYLFHPAVADVALWFDRSQTALETRDIFRHAAPATADPVSFAVGNSRSASSLRQVYANAGGGKYRSTALAVAPIGAWIVSIRMTADTLTADQLDARLQQAIKAVRWPDATTSLIKVAVPVRACATPLTFTKAKTAKPDGVDMLMTLVASGMAAKQKTEKPTDPAPSATWCREGKARAEYGVYRSGPAADGYVMALYDAGRVVSVYPSLMGQMNKSGTYAVMLGDVKGTNSYLPSFTALPSPKQVWEVVRGGKTAGTSKGNQITIDSKAM